MAVLELVIAALGGWVVGMTMAAVAADRRQKALQVRYDALQDRHEKLRYIMGTRTE